MRFSLAALAINTPVKLGVGRQRRVVMRQPVEAGRSLASPAFRTCPSVLIEEGEVRPVPGFEDEEGEIQPVPGFED